MGECHPCIVWYYSPDPRRGGQVAKCCGELQYLPEVLVHESLPQNVAVVNVLFQLRKPLFVQPSEEEGSEVSLRCYLSFYCFEGFDIVASNRIHVQNVHGGGMPR